MMDSPNQPPHPTPISQSSFNSYLRSNFIEQLGIEQIGATPIRAPLSIEQYRKWIAQDLHGSMDYLKTHLPLKENPKLIETQLKSAIVLTQPYTASPRTPWTNTSDSSNGPIRSPTQEDFPVRVARYAELPDYHHWLKEKLLFIIEDLKTQYPNGIFLPFVDSGPIMERDLGYQMGFGWFGKNSCLIHKKFGSLFFIAEILTSIELQEDVVLQPSPDHCGTCTRCIDLCPTQAIRPDRTLTATKCISFLTIESKTVPPTELRAGIGDWFFGCDVCQEVCPWNQKILKSSSTQSEANGDREATVAFLHEVLTVSGKKLQKKFIGSPLLRAGSFGLRRNAMILIANQKMHELKNEVQKFVDDPKLGELAQWTLDQLT